MAAAPNLLFVGTSDVQQATCTKVYGRGIYICHADANCEGRALTSPTATGAGDVGLLRLTLDIVRESMACMRRLRRHCLRLRSLQLECSMCRLIFEAQPIMSYSQVLHRFLSTPMPRLREHMCQRPAVNARLDCFTRVNSSLSRLPRSPTRRAVKAMHPRSAGMCKLAPAQHPCVVTTAHAVDDYRSILRSRGPLALPTANVSAYNRVKGRSHIVDQRVSMQSHKPHATSQPSLFSHTHSAGVTAQQAQALRGSHTRPDSAQTRHTTSIAANSAPYTRPIMTSALALQSQHRSANPTHVRLSANSAGTSQHSLGPTAPSPKAAAPYPR